jgi:hypothetical protein
MAGCGPLTERQESYMDDRKFEVRCNASHNGQLHVRTRSLSVAVSQLIKRNASDEMWQSLLVICEETEDGSLTTKIIVCHPDWDQNLQIATIRSPIPHQKKARPTLEIDLKSTRV